MITELMYPMRFFVFGIVILFYYLLIFKMWRYCNKLQLATCLLYLYVCIMVTGTLFSRQIYLLSKE